MRLFLFLTRQFKREFGWSVTGILVLKILVPRTNIFSGKLVRPDHLFREKWSALGKSVPLESQPLVGSWQRILLLILLLDKVSTIALVSRARPSRKGEGLARETSVHSYIYSLAIIYKF